MEVPRGISPRLNVARYTFGPEDLPAPFVANKSAATAAAVAMNTPYIPTIDIENEVFAGLAGKKCSLSPEVMPADVMSSTEATAASAIGTDSKATTPLSPSAAAEAATAAASGAALEATATARTAAAVCGPVDAFVADVESSVPAEATSAAASASSVEATASAVVTAATAASTPADGPVAAAASTAADDPSIVAAPATVTLNVPAQKLKILCLHGFRQNASQFKGRTNALRKKLKDLVELVFIDAPFVLPNFYKPPSVDPTNEVQAARLNQTDCSFKGSADGYYSSNLINGNEPDSKEPIEMQAASLSQDDAHGPVHCTEVLQSVSETKNKGPFSTQQHVLRQSSEVGTVGGNLNQSSGQLCGYQDVSSPGNLSRRRAWLVSPEILQMISDGHPTEWVAAPAFVDSNQHTQQTQGLSTALHTLRAFFEARGPFDGVLGFSQ